MKKSKVQTKNLLKIYKRKTSSSTKIIGKKEPKKYLCEICTKEFMWRNDLRKHLRIHSNERPFLCVHCGRKFRQSGCLKNHIASQHGTNILFTCHYCNKSFPIKERLRLHMRVHSGEKPYKCSLCPKVFARGGQVTQHMISHFGVKKYRCIECPAAFPIYASLKLHLKSHFGERDYVCETCGKNFNRPDALKKHISCYHGNVKAFYCNICNKAFKGHLPQHMQTHAKNKIYGCAECGVSFAQNSQLKVHQRIHSGERPYRCQVCWQAFGHSSVLKLHIRKHTGEKPFKCPLCAEKETAFSQLPHLKTHMRAIHGMDKSYLCENCQQFFRTKQDLVTHNVNCKSTTAVSNDKMYTNIYTDSVNPVVRLTQLRLLVAVLLKKISTQERLKQLGYEKRLIDNVLIGALKSAGQPCCEDETISETEKLRANIRQFLEWTVPEKFMNNFQRQQKSVEELLQELTSNLGGD